MYKLDDKQKTRLLEYASKDRPWALEEATGVRWSRQRIDYHLKNFKAPKKAKDVYERVLVISDIHAPYNHKDLLEFYADIKTIVNPDFVANVGDELDSHAMSFHDSDPDLDSAGVELKKGRAVLQDLARIYPTMTLATSNHGSLAYRRQKAHGIPKHMILPYRDVLFAGRDEDGNIIPSELGKEWVWKDRFFINTPLGKVMVHHGQDTVDVKRSVRENGTSVIRGHYHALLNIEWILNGCGMNFGMTVGCGCDAESLAFAYGKNFNSKPIVGCGLIMNGIPKLVPMPLDEEGRYQGIEQLKKVIM